MSSRLTLHSDNAATKTVAGIYKDLERRIQASPPGHCPTELMASYLRVAHSQSCGKCIPCRLGLKQLTNIFDEILSLNSEKPKSMEMLHMLKVTAEVIRETADCAIGFEAADMVLRALKDYEDDIVSHIKYNTCDESVRSKEKPVPCVAKCPAGVDIPGYIALIKEGRYDDAVRVIRRDNPFPTVCALICEHPCEARCRRNLIDTPINIRGLKRFAVDNCGDVPVPERMEETGKKVAVIGGGPSGLTAAYFLSLMGHKVTVFEKREKLGGMLRYGIPNYRLPRERLQWDIDAIISAGVEVVRKSDVSTAEDLTKLRKDFDAAYISIGSHNAKSLGIEGQFAKGVIPAVEMLRGIGDEAMPDFEGKTVAVVGGGNVAMDVARTAKRLGAVDVSIIYRRRKQDMTALPEEVDAAIAEGCNLVTLKAPSRVVTTKEGFVESLWVQPQIAGMADASGRPKPVPASEPEEIIPCDIIIAAIGQATDVSFVEESGIPVYRGNIKAGKNTEIADFDGMYSGGDCVTGPATVIKAIAAGKVAAANIDQFLGYHHEITVDVDIPHASPSDDKPCGRSELKERYAKARGNDFDEVEQGMSLEEAMQEASRCLRCDYHGAGCFMKGGVKRW